jgi:hypothetical protein
MKNLPEKDFWKDVGNRLDAYTEEPDRDSWDKIAGAISSPQPPKGLVWIDRFAGVALLIYLSFMAGYSVGRKDLTVTPAYTNSSAPGVAMIPGDAGSDGETNSAGITMIPGNTSDDGEMKSATQPMDEETDSRTVPAGPAVKKQEGSTESAGQSLTGMNSHTPGQEQSSNGSVSRLRSNSKKEGLMVASVNDATGRKRSSGGDDKTNVLPDENAVTSAAENTASVTTPDMRAQRSKLHAGSNVSPADTVMDSLAVAKVIPADSAVEKTEAEPKTPAKKKQKVHPQFYVTLAPSLSFQKLTPEQTDAVNVRGMRSPGILSSDRFGISLEAGLQRPLTKHLEVYTGISYYQQKQNLTYEYLSPDNVEVTSPGNGQYTVKPKMETRDFQYSMLNAGISAGLFYRIKGEKLMHKLGAGIQYQKGLLRAGSEDTYDNAGSSYLNYQISYRVEYLLNSKVNIFVQPSFTHSFYAKEKLAEPFTIKPYRAGIGFGIIYHF